MLFNGLSILKFTFGASGSPPMLYHVKRKININTLNKCGPNIVYGF